MERILQESDAGPMKEARRRAAYPLPENEQQSEEFITLLKSAVNENMLDTIPYEDLLDICKQAQSINDSGKGLDIELSRAIDTLSEEIKKRGLSEKRKPQEVVHHGGSPKIGKSGGMTKWVYALFVILIIVIVIALGEMFFPDKDQGKRKKAIVNEFTDSLKGTREVAERGDAAAQFRLGWMYAEGKGVTRDHKEALKWYTKAAEQGDAWAQYNLGVMYNNDKDVMQDHKEALKWYTKAAEQGLTAAQYNLGVMYYNGTGVTRDHKEALKWYTKAAEQGLTAAQYNLGVMYYNGTGVLQNSIEAYKWWDLAAAQGDEGARKSRDYLMTIISPQQIGEAQRLSREFTPKIQK